jgi:hypothetical protein
MLLTRYFPYQDNCALCSEFILILQPNLISNVFHIRTMNLSWFWIHTTMYLIFQFSTGYGICHGFVSIFHLWLHFLICKCMRPNGIMLLLFFIVKWVIRYEVWLQNEDKFVTQCTIVIMRIILSQRCYGDNSNWLNKILHGILLGQYQPIILRDLT